MSTALLMFILAFSLSSCGKGETIVTESTLEKAVEVSDLSVAEYNYNGVYEHHEEDSDKVDYRIKYNAVVKVGINMGDIKFTIDEENKTVTPVLPELTINDVIVDTQKIKRNFRRKKYECSQRCQTGWYQPNHSLYNCTERYCDSI